MDYLSIRKAITAGARTVDRTLMPIDLVKDYLGAEVEIHEEDEIINILGEDLVVQLALDKDTTRVYRKADEGVSE